MSGERESSAFDGSHVVVLFDGVCNLCSGIVEGEGRLELEPVGRDRDLATRHEMASSTTDGVPVDG